MMFYLRKEAASEEAEKSETLFEYSYIDLWRQDRVIRRTNNKIREVKDDSQTLNEVQTEG